MALKISESEILAAQKEMAREEVFGVFTAAVSFAGLKKQAKSTNLDCAVTVAVSSSCGLKDFTVIAGNQPEPPMVRADFEALERVAADIYGIRFDRL